MLRWTSLFAELYPSVTRKRSFSWTSHWLSNIAEFACKSLSISEVFDRIADFSIIEIKCLQSSMQSENQCCLFTDRRAKNFAAGFTIIVQGTLESDVNFSFKSCPFCIRTTSRCKSLSKNAACRVRNFYQHVTRNTRTDCRRLQTHFCFFSLASKDCLTQSAKLAKGPGYRNFASSATFA